VFFCTGKWFSVREDIPMNIIQFPIKPINKPISKTKPKTKAKPKTRAIPDCFIWVDDMLVLKSEAKQYLN
jgi:hypothetical protein